MAEIKFDKEKLEQILGFEIVDLNLYITAFTHRSYLNEHTECKNPSNERLEFLGDAVLQLTSSQFLYETFPEAPEGDLTNFRASIVCTPSLADEARKLGYGEFLLLSNGEEATGGRNREYILANTFEAVLGAIYLEKGLEYCKAFIQSHLLYKVPQIVQNQEYKDAKSKFQEIAQTKFGITPSYEVLESWGADHEKTFKVGLYVNGKQYGVGEGRSKQKAEQQAASNALETISLQ